ncbi:aminopeptidase N-like [Ceratina calcarata]|uniref:Aminopeptidase n=1 Tax=Ceratina calcarata TaxID=156304 RepID=A0AAJ7WEK4_9HYME|nr:aminopeptidase N-like [Ceratina calcarata]
MNSLLTIDSVSWVGLDAGSEKLLRKELTMTTRDQELTALLVERKLTESLEAAMRQTTMNIMSINQYKSTVDKWLSDNSDLFENPASRGNGGGCWILNVASESKMARTFVPFLLVLGIFQTSFLLANTNDETVYSKFRLPSGIVTPTAYKLYLRPNLSRSIFWGDVDITLTALITSSNLILNAKEMIIYGVTFEDLNTTEVFENEYVEDKEHEILNITIIPQFLKDHHYSLRIKYLAVLNEDMKGFYRSKVIQGGKITGYIATTHFQPTFARQAFPCWDEPMYKAKFNISIMHNKTMKAISNMDVLKTEEKSDVIITTFKETPVMSTYLVAFTISDYQFKEDKVGNFTYRVWTKASAINQTDYALKMGRKLLEQLNLYTNMSYQTYMPDKIDQVSVQNLFGVPAMENWGLVTYRERSLLYDEALSTTQKKMDILTLIAHAFTQQWFGNVVTPKWWRYHWLKEGFANYFEYFIAHKIAPELRLNDVFVVESTQMSAMVVDALPGMRALNMDVYSPERILVLSDSIVYEKGYYRVLYDVENWQLLMKELNKGSDTKIHVLNRAQIVDDAFSLAHTGNLNYTVALNVTLYLTQETDFMPWQPAFKHLGYLRNLLRTSDKYYTFTRYVAYLLRALTNDVGYEPKANDTDLVKMLRVEAMRWACEAGVEKCTSYAEKTYQQWLKNPEMKLDVNLKTEILCAGVRKASESEWTDTLEYIITSKLDEDDKKDLLMALACSNSSEILMTYLNSTLEPSYPIDFKTGVKNVVSKYPAGAELVLKFLFKENNLELFTLSINPTISTLAYFL